MSPFIEWLESLNEKDTKVRAVLKRSLAFDPGLYPGAYPFVEPFLKGDVKEWSRKAHYLVAGLWAQHWRAGRPGPELSMGKASASYQIQSGSTNTERRFVSLLDSDIDQLSHRLRQMVALLKEQSIDFDELLKGVIFWNDDQKRTQNTWARDFYRNLTNENNFSEEKKQ